MHCSLPHVTTCAYCRCFLFPLFPGTKVIIMLQCSRTPKKAKAPKHTFMFNHGHHHFWNHMGGGRGAETNVSQSILTQGILTPSNPEQFSPRFVLLTGIGKKRSRPHRKESMSMSSQQLQLLGQSPILPSFGWGTCSWEKMLWFVGGFFSKGQEKKRANGSCFT